MGSNVSCSDAQDLHFVYDWRQEQERTLLAAKGTGMTPEQVTHFVNGCTLPRYSFSLLCAGRCIKRTVC